MKKKSAKEEKKSCAYDRMIRKKKGEQGIQ